jgi:hypothetical protein
MSTQTGDTYYDGRASTNIGLGVGINGQGLDLERLGFVRFNTYGFDFGVVSGQTAARYTSFNRLAAISCATAGIRTNGNGGSATHSSVYANSCGTGFILGATNVIGNAGNTIMEQFECSNCTTGFFVNAGAASSPGFIANTQLDNLVLANCATGLSIENLSRGTFGSARIYSCDSPMFTSGGTFFACKNIVFTDLICDTQISVATQAEFPRLINSSVNSFAGTRTNATQANSTLWTNDLYLVNTTITAATEVTDFSAGRNPRLYSHNHDNTAGNHKIFTDFGLISAATDQRNTASGISWKLQPTSSTSRTSAYPLTLSLAKVAVAANSLVTIKAWMRRDNSGLTMRLVCKGGQIAGVASDVTSSVSATNAWEEEIITFTPTETGVVEITAEAWGGTTLSGWVDDLTISQA